MILRRPWCKALDGFGNRYEKRGADVPLQLSLAAAYSATVQDGSSGSTKVRSVRSVRWLRARVVSWPPLRLARLRRERGFYASLEDGLAFERRIIAKLFHDAKEGFSAFAEHRVPKFPGSEDATGSYSRS